MRIVSLLMIVLSANALADATCPSFLGGVITGSPAYAGLSELSGLAASRQSPGVLWAHNDSGDGPNLYALRPDGTHLGIYTLGGATASDWEDIAIGPGPVGGVDYLYVADTGNNALARDVVTIYRVAEPFVDPHQAPVTLTVPGADALPVTYPTAPLTTYDCETIWSDPRTGDLYLITKDTQANRDGGVSFLYRYPAPQTPNVTFTLELAGSISLGTGLFDLATGGDIAPDGSAMLLRTYGTAYYWPRAVGQSVAGAFAATPCNVPLTLDIQGEAIAFSADNRGFYTGSEEAILTTTQPIRYYARKDLVVDLDGPAQVQARPGDSVTLRVTAASETPISYQWFRGSPAKSAALLSGATGAAYTIVMANTGDSGDYYCAVSDADENVNSPVIHLVVAAHMPLGPYAALAAFVILGGMFARRARRE